MGKNNYLLLLVLFIFGSHFLQASPEKYIVYFKDKKTDVNVSSLFFEKALEKRKKYKIAFDERDYPVNADYIMQLKSKAVEVVNESNWLNAALVIADEAQLKILPFIASYTKVKKTDNGGIASTTEINKCEGATDIQDFENNYNSSFPQVNLLKGEYLHEQGFSGENMIIAVCDNGFYNVNNNPAFSPVFNENRLLGTYSYIHGDSLVYNLTDGKHGAYCFSFIGGLKDNQFIGTATKSNYYLFQTEDDNNGIERLQEELNLAIALERCAQLGVDVVSISLGYFKFDVPSENHDTSDLRKNITPGAKAVNIASSKGLLVCVAAGNEGASSWKYIITPADADSAFAIASVDVNGTPASSSSLGLPNDPRIKPNVAAVGQNPFLINTSGQVGQFGSGTSFATPQIAGLSACLWQAFPDKTNWEIKTAIEQSASQYLTPDKKIGYGIPDFQKAYNLLANPTFVSDKSLQNEIAIYPNPFQSTFNIVQNGTIKIRSIEMLNNIGQSIYSVQAPTENIISLPELPNGMYLLQIATDKGVLIKKLIKE